MKSDVPYRTKLRLTKFSADEIFRRTKDSASGQNFGSFVRQIFFSVEVEELIADCEATIKQ